MRVVNQLARRSIFFLTLSVVTLSSVAHGESKWDDGGATDLWSDAANWNGDNVAIPPDNLLGTPFPGELFLNVAGITTTLDFDMNAGGAQWDAVSVSSGEGGVGNNQTHTVTPTGHMYIEYIPSLHDDPPGTPPDLNFGIQFAGDNSSLTQQAGSRVTSDRNIQVREGFHWTVDGGAVTQTPTALIPSSPAFSLNATDAGFTPEIIINDNSTVDVETIINAAVSGKITINGAGTVVNTRDDGFQNSNGVLPDAFVINDGTITGGTLNPRDGDHSIVVNGGDITLTRNSVNAIHVQAQAGQTQNPTLSVNGGSITNQAGNTLAGANINRSGTLRVAGGSLVMDGEFRFSNVGDNPSDAVFHVDGSGATDISFGALRSIGTPAPADSIFRFTLDPGGVTPISFTGFGGPTNLSLFSLLLDGQSSLAEIPLLSFTGSFVPSEFSNASEGALFNLGSQYLLTYDLNGDQALGDIGLSRQVLAVPEPSSLLLAWLGIGMLLVPWRRRRRC